MSIYDIDVANRVVIDVPNTALVNGESAVAHLINDSKATWILDAPVQHTLYMPYNGANIPFVRDWYIDSNSGSSATWVGNVPGRIAGDLLVAAIMTRTGGGNLTGPDGWDYQGTYLEDLDTGDGNYQSITVFTRKSIGAGTVTATWTQDNADAICGLIVSVGNGSILNSNEVYGSGNTVSIDNAGADFYLTIASWIDTNDLTPQTYAQSGTGIGKITDSPSLSARISGSYSTFDTTVTSDYVLAGSSGDHGIFTLGFQTDLDGGGQENVPSDRPESGFLYPRRLY